jgi:hypothetical protein
MDGGKTIYAAVGAALLGFVAFAAIEGHHAVFRDDNYEQDDQGDRAAVAQALTFTKVSLQQGLTASELEGQPISAKFELDRGTLQLSVHTSKGGRFSKVLVDYSTGSIAKVQPITEGDDLAGAQLQSAAMAKAKTSLKEAVEQAVKQAPNSRALSVVSELIDGRAVACVLLFLKNEQEF